MNDLQISQKSLQMLTLLTQDISLSKDRIIKTYITFSVDVNSRCLFVTFCWQCRDFVNEGASKGISPGDVVQLCDITFSCVSDSAALKDVRYSQNLKCFAAMQFYWFLFWLCYNKTNFLFELVLCGSSFRMSFSLFIFFIIFSILPLIGLFLYLSFPIPKFFFLFFYSLDSAYFFLSVVWISKTSH